MFHVGFVIFADFFFFLTLFTGVDGSIDYSILALPTRYSFFYAYLVLVGICMVLALPWLILRVIFIVRPGSNGVFLSRRLQFINIGKNATFIQCC